MQRFRKILVGIDLASADQLADAELAPPSQEALRRAIWLAAHTQADLTILTTLESVHGALHPDDEHTGGLMREAGAALDRFVAQAKQEGVIAKTKLAIGSPWKEICRQVLANEHDLVVVGTRDLASFGRILFGTTATRLLRNCPCPVWVTRPDPDWADLNILVPSDFSDVSQEALRIAVNGGQLVDTRLHLLHALEGQLRAPGWFGTAQKQMLHDYVAGERANAEQRLHEQLSSTDYRTLPRGVQVHVVDGPPDEAILKAIDELGIDLVVMGTSARSGLSSVVIGNTAERLISHMKCSVIAVKPSGFHCPIKLHD